jgi:hypothetical protein
MVFVDEAHHAMTQPRLRLLRDAFEPPAVRIALRGDYDEAALGRVMSAAPRPGVPPHKAPSRGKAPLIVAAKSAPQTSASPESRRDEVEQVTERPPSVPRSPFAFGFVDGVKNSYKHARD